jgi:hypothetical protein
MCWVINDIGPSSSWLHLWKIFAGLIADFPHLHNWFRWCNGIINPCLQRYMYELFRIPLYTNVWTTGLINWRTKYYWMKSIWYSMWHSTLVCLHMRQTAYQSIEACLGSYLVQYIHWWSAYRVSKPGVCVMNYILLLHTQILTSRLRHSHINGIDIYISPLLYPGREHTVDVALWRGRNSNLSQGLEVKVPCSSND